jgi:ribosomal protein S18 acetylase RimI-like enzyme
MTTESITIAQQQDCPQLCALLSELFEQEADFSPDSSKQQRALEDIIFHPEKGHILVLKKDITIIGMVSLLYLPSTAMGGKVALLEDMIIGSQWRHQGYGKMLLSAAETFAKQQKCLRITLLTDHNNLTSQRLYQKQGFNFSDMLVMRKLIEE